MQADRRMYLNKDKTKVIEEGQEGAASLLAGKGGEVPKEYESLVKDHSALENKDAGSPPENKGEGTAGGGGLSIEKSKERTK